MSKKHTDTLHPFKLVYNDMFNHMDGVMRALDEKKPQWKEDLFFAVKLAQQKLSIYVTGVTTPLDNILSNLYMYSDAYGRRSYSLF